MQQDIHHISHNKSDQIIRMRVTYPSVQASSSEACILINSGRIARFDDDKYETELFDKIRHLLVREGVSVFEIDFAQRDINQFGATEDEIEQRLIRLHHILNHSSFVPFRKKYSILALSLGGQVALRLAEDSSLKYPSPKQLVLISTVVERSITVFADVSNIHLVYGGNDYVGYLVPGQKQIEMMSPEEYYLSSIKNLVVRRSQKVFSHILKGYGHVLNQVENVTKENPVDYLLALLVPVGREI